MGIYTTSAEEDVISVLNSTEAVVCVVDSELQFFKVMQIWDQVPSLKAVIKYFEPLQSDYKDVYSVSVSREMYCELFIRVTQKV